MIIASLQKHLTLEDDLVNIANCSESFFLAKLCKTECPLKISSAKFVVALLILNTHNFHNLAILNCICVENL